MEERDLKNWEEFDARIKDDQRIQGTESCGSRFLFRGQPCSKMKLATTLERTDKRAVRISDYYHIAYKSKGHVEAFTGDEWKVGSYDKCREWEEKLYSNTLGSIDPFFEFRYLAYLRHHGFPSPLLDWTESPYVAAYFAFFNLKKDVEQVSIYLYQERADRYKVILADEPEIIVLTEDSNVHKRHFLQQSKYTVCIVRQKPIVLFGEHEWISSNGRHGQDLFWKFNLPISERPKVMKMLYQMNINAFSLFGTEKSLMQTIAYKKFELNEDNFQTALPGKRQG